MSLTFIFVLDDYSNYDSKHIHDFFCSPHRYISKQGTTENVSGW